MRKLALIFLPLVFSVACLAQPALLVSSAGNTPSPPSGAGTSSPLEDTTGATLIVAQVSDFSQDCRTDTVTDSNGNSWHLVDLATTGADASALNTCTWIAYDHAGSPLVVGPSYSMTVTGNYDGYVYAAFSGTYTGGNPLDTNAEAVTLTNVNTQVTGTLTVAANELVVTGFSTESAGTYTVGTPYTLGPALNYNSGAFMSAALGYHVATAGSTSATWSNAGTAAETVSTIVSFHPAGWTPPGTKVVHRVTQQ